MTAIDVFVVAVAYWVVFQKRFPFMYIWLSLAEWAAEANQMPMRRLVKFFINSLNLKSFEVRKKKKE